MENLKTDCMLGLNMDDMMFAYRKETARILKLSKGSPEINISQGLDKLKSMGYLSADEIENIKKCATETILTRQGKSNSNRSLSLIRNTTAKALINGSSNILYLNLLNLLTGLVREVSDFEDNNESEDEQVAFSATSPSRSTTFPAGSGAAIITGAIAGAVVGGRIGGIGGAIIGAVVGAAVGASSDVTVQSGGSGGTT